MVLYGLAPAVTMYSHCSRSRLTTITAHILRYIISIRRRMSGTEMQPHEV